MKSNEKVSDTPFVDALKEYVLEDIAPFDVPGHHMGNIENAATELFGKNLYRYDVNAPLGLDNLAKPKGVLLEAEKLWAKRAHADEAFFLINGTSSGILAMFLTALKANEKVILPRNVHKSAINGLILSGAVPVYVMPQIDEELGIANQPTLEDWKKAIAKNPSAKAIYVIHPTYFGAVGDLAALVRLAHEHHMAVLVDEAHGAHGYFHAKGAPITAMDAGADLSAASTHKTAGSLTQSSLLFAHTERFSRYEIQKALNLINTTSPSSLLLASLDAAGTYLEGEGKILQERAYVLVDEATRRINGIPGFSVKGREHFLRHGCFDYDRSKLVIALDHLDLDGFALYRLLKERFSVQVELAEPHEILCIFALGTRQEHVDRLVSALESISKQHYQAPSFQVGFLKSESFPFMLLRPRAAFHAPGKKVSLAEAPGCISKEMVMMYPPGIPLICPGEVWTKDLAARVKEYQNSGVTLLSTYPDGLEVVDVAKWKRYPVYQRRLEEYLLNRKTTPANDGFSMPFEGEEHQATVVLLPFRADTWREKGVPARKSYRGVIEAIARYEKVIVGIHPCIYASTAPEFSSIPNVEVIKIRYNDAWARDNMGLFVRRGNKLRCVDFRFNAWGGDFDGLYQNYKDDDHLASTFAKRYRYGIYYHPSFVFEGGSIAVDGQGTAIVTEACLLSPGRNPTKSKEEIEETIKEYLGIEKLIWVPHGIYLDETNEHIDNMVAFVRPGVVALAWTENREDPQYAFCQSTFDALSLARDAKGRKLEIHKILLPDPPLWMSEEEARSLKKGKFHAKERNALSRLSASYINFYQGKDFVVMPGFGVKEDRVAKKQIAALFPDKEIHQVPTREILLGGGNIHCITMQIPKGERS